MAEHKSPDNNGKAPDMNAVLRMLAAKARKGDLTPKPPSVASVMHEGPAPGGMEETKDERNQPSPPPQSPPTWDLGTDETPADNRVLQETSAQGDGSTIDRLLEGLESVPVSEASDVPPPPDSLMGGFDMAADVEALINGSESETATPSQSGPQEAAPEADSGGAVLRFPSPPKVPTATGPQLPVVDDVPKRQSGSAVGESSPVQEAGSRIRSSLPPEREEGSSQDEVQPGPAPARGLGEEHTLHIFHEFIKGMRPGGKPVTDVTGLIDGLKEVLAPWLNEHLGAAFKKPKAEASSEGGPTAMTPRRFRSLARAVGDSIAVQEGMSEGLAGLEDSMALLMGSDPSKTADAMLLYRARTINKHVLMTLATEDWRDEARKLFDSFNATEVLLVLGSSGADEKGLADTLVEEGLATEDEAEAKAKTLAERAKTAFDDCKFTQCVAMLLHPSHKALMGQALRHLGGYSMEEALELAANDLMSVEQELKGMGVDPDELADQANEVMDRARNVLGPDD